MIKHKAKINDAITEISNNKNNAVSYIFNNAKFTNGPLNGATITVKDLFATKVGTTQGSSQILKNFCPDYDATVIKKIKKNGGAIIAKVHLDELGLGGTGGFSGYGKIINPLDKNRIIGGSSSGSVATFTNNISLALATDTGDSIRAPASYNGCVGFKPSYGAVSRFGVFPYASSLDTVGMLTHNVSDAIVFSQVIFGIDPFDLTTKKVKLPQQKIIKPQKIAILNDEENVLSPPIKKTFQKLINKLKNENIVVEKFTIKIDILKAIAGVYKVISFSEACSNNSNLTGLHFGTRSDGKTWKEIMFNTRSKGFGNMVQRRFALGAYFLAVENQEKIFIRAQKIRRLIKDSFNKIYEKYDFLMFPATDIAPLIDSDKEKNWYLNYLTSSNLIGNPSISIPFSKINGMPFGLSLDCKIYDDKKLLSYGLYIEKIIKNGDFNE